MFLERRESVLPSQVNDRGRIVGLVALCAALIVGGVAGLIGYAWHEIDRAEVDRETLLLTRDIDRSLRQVREQALSATVWDDAYDRTSPKTDLAWVESGLDYYMRETFGHDINLFFDPQGRAVYAAAGRGPRPPAEFAPLVAELRADVEAIRKEEAARRLQPGYDV